MRKIILAIILIWALASCTRPDNQIICPRPPTAAPTEITPYAPPPEIVPTYLPTAQIIPSQSAPPSVQPTEEPVSHYTPLPVPTVPSRINPPARTPTPMGDPQGGVCWFW